MAEVANRILVSFLIVRLLVLVFQAPREKDFKGSSVSRIEDTVIREIRVLVDQSRKVSNIAAGTPFTFQDEPSSRSTEAEPESLVCRFEQVVPDASYMQEECNVHDQRGIDIRGFKVGLIEVMQGFAMPLHCPLEVVECGLANVRATAIAKEDVVDASDYRTAL